MLHHGAICESLGYSNMLNEDHEDLEHLTVPRGSGFQAILLHEDDLQNNGPGPPEASTILTKKYKKQTDKWTPYVANNYKHLHDIHLAVMQIVAVLQCFEVLSCAYIRSISLSVYSYSSIDLLTWYQLCHGQTSKKCPLTYVRIYIYICNL